MEFSKRDIILGSWQILKEYLGLWVFLSNTIFSSNQSFFALILKT